MKHLRFDFGSWLEVAATSVATSAAFASMGDIAWSRVYVAVLLWATVLTVVVGMVYFVVAAHAEGQGRR